MFKQSIRLFIITYAFWLSYNQNISLASDLIVNSHQSSHNSVNKSADQSEDLVTQPIHLKISLSRHQVTVYEGKLPIKSYPIAVGRRGWETPIGNFQVTEMLENPTWINPLTDKSIPGGTPENPLGHYWIGFWTDGRNSIGFHSAPNPESVGKATSHGCIRMYSKDVEDLFHKVNVGTPVSVVR